MFAGTQAYAHQTGDTRSGFDHSRSLSQGYQPKLGNFQYMDQDVSSNALSQSGIQKGTNNSTVQNPIIVEILKQELISTKRQLKDQQASNQFLKKEKFKVEHEKNLIQIQLNQGVDKMEAVIQDFESIN